MKKRRWFAALAALVFCMTTVQANPSSSGDPFLVREGIGITDVTVGKSTAAEVIAAFGKDFELIEHGEYSKEMRYAERGLTFWYCAQDRKQLIFEIGLRAPATATTAKGVILNDTPIREVIRLYGKPDWRTIADGPTWWVEYKGVQFHVRKETTVNQFPLDESKYLDKPVMAIHIEKPDAGNCPGSSQDDERR